MTITRSDDETVHRTIAKEEDAREEIEARDDEAKVVVDPLPFGEGNLLKIWSIPIIFPVVRLFVIDRITRKFAERPVDPRV